MRLPRPARPRSPAGRAGRTSRRCSRVGLAAVPGRAGRTGSPSGLREGWESSSWGARVRRNESALPARCVCVSRVPDAPPCARARSFEPLEKAQRSFCRANEGLRSLSPTFVRDPDQGFQLGARSPVGVGAGRGRAFGRDGRFARTPPPSLECRPPSARSRSGVGYLAAVGPRQVPGASPLVPRTAPEYVVRVGSLPVTDYRNVLVTDEGPVTRIILNRPDKRNALSLELIEEVIGALRESPRQDSRAIVIEGAGPVFSAGHDLSEMVGRERDFLARLFDRCSAMMQTIHEAPQPVIAKVHGVATAAGCQLVAACDLAVAAEGTRFATPGVKIGLFCSTPMVPVSRSVGRKRALELLLTGEPIGAETAREWGLVNRVVPAGELDAAVLEVVEAIARSSSYTVATGKRAFYRQIDHSQTDAYEHCQLVMTDNAVAHDAQEGMTAFLEKRAPVWRGE